MFLSYICVWLCLKCGQAVTCFLSYIRVWLCLKCVGRHVFCHPYAFGYVLNVWAGCNNMFCHIYAFGNVLSVWAGCNNMYVLSVWAGCNNMFFVIHMRLVMS